MKRQKQITRREFYGHLLELGDDAEGLSEIESTVEDLLDSDEVAREEGEVAREEGEVAREEGDIHRLAQIAILDPIEENRIEAFKKIVNTPDQEKRKEGLYICATHGRRETIFGALIYSARHKVPGLESFCDEIIQGRIFKKLGEIRRNPEYANHKFANLERYLTVPSKGYLQFYARLYLHVMRHDSPSFLDGRNTLVAANIGRSISKLKDFGTPQDIKWKHIPDINTNPLLIILAAITYYSPDERYLIYKITIRNKGKMNASLVRIPLTTAEILRDFNFIGFLAALLEHIKYQSTTRHFLGTRLIKIIEDPHITKEEYRQFITSFLSLQTREYKKNVSLHEKEKWKPMKNSRRVGYYAYSQHSSNAKESTTISNNKFPIFDRILEKNGLESLEIKEILFILEHIKRDSISDEIFQALRKTKNYSAFIESLDTDEMVALSLHKNITISRYFGKMVQKYLAQDPIPQELIALLIKHQHPLTFDAIKDLSFEPLSFSKEIMIQGLSSPDPHVQDIFWIMFNREIGLHSDDERLAEIIVSLVFNTDQDDFYLRVEQIIAVHFFNNDNNLNTILLSLAQACNGKGSRYNNKLPKVIRERVCSIIDLIEPERLLKIKPAIFKQIQTSNDPVITLLGSLLLATIKRPYPTPDVIEGAASSKFQVIRRLLLECLGKSKENKNKLKKDYDSLLLLMESPNQDVFSFTTEFIEKNVRGTKGISALLGMLINSTKKQCRSYALSLYSEKFESGNVSEGEMFMLLEHPSDDVKKQVASFIGEKLVEMVNRNPRTTLDYIRSILLAPNKFSKAKDKVYPCLAGIASLWPDYKNEIKSLLEGIASNQNIKDRERALKTYIKIF
ncbi:MAG: hypothetical protein ACTSUE_14800 [Promethearchaeota archaeon]